MEFFARIARTMQGDSPKPLSLLHATVRVAKETFMFLGVHSSPLRVLFVCGLIAASALTSLAAGPASQPADNPAAKKAQAAQDYGRIPLSFEANQGQADKAVKFLSRGSGYSLFLTDSSAVLALRKPDGSNAKPGRPAGNVFKPASARHAGQTDVVRMDLAGASPGIRVSGNDPLPGTANYFLGNDAAQWHSDVPTYAKVEYTGVYPGIDLVYYGNQRQLEYDFIVAPEASPKPIRLHFAEAKKLDLTTHGDLIVSAANGEIAFHKPVVYQMKDGQRMPVEARFAMLSRDTVGFTLGRYDRSQPLVIDPVLTYSTYLGGGLADSANAVAVDSSGNAYIVGTTYSTNFPVTTGAFQSKNNGSTYSVTNVFVAKLNPTGTALMYSTYLGGSGLSNGFYGDDGYAIAVDSSGDAYVTGATYSQNFPVTKGAFQTVNNSLRTFSENAFVTKLNPTGTALVYSTYLGGSAGDEGTGIAVDASGDAYVIGSATSTNFPVTTGVFQSTNVALTTSGWGEAFITKLNPTGASLVYSTYLGGTSYGATGYGIAIDSSGDAYVSGNSYSTDFPVTSGAFQTVNNAAAAAGPDTVASNAYVAKLNPTATALEYATYLGGSIDDYGGGIAVDGSGNAYVTGYSMSSNYPVTSGAFQPTNKAYANQGANAFVTKVNPTGTGLVYSTYLGGTGLAPLNDNSSGSGDTGEDIAVDSLGDAYVTGSAISTNFPVTSGAYQTVNNAAGYYASTGTIGINAFVTELNPAGSALLYSTYFGGSAQEIGYGIAVDSLGGVFIVGSATSTNLPVTTGALQTVIGGDEDGFVAELAIGPVGTTVATTTTFTVSPSTLNIGQTATLKATVTKNTGSGTPTGSVKFVYGSTTLGTVALNPSGVASFSASTAGLPAGSYALMADYSGDSADASSSGSLTVPLSKNTTTTVVSITPNPIPANSTATLKATVTRADSTGTATGTATFYAGTTALGPAVSLNGSGVATLSASDAGIAAGTYPIHAVYNGDAADNGSTSATVNAMVQ